MFAARNYYSGYPAHYDEYEEDMSPCDYCKYDCSEVGVCIAIINADDGDDPDAI